ncbi:autotransporter outer membrane beta-barrel domain-containing protein [Planctomicrobium piriforme]|uniref:hypothetical protein n=1 Tax=Planctomicrobium piriforme TaxID=1576369 RepID=UPI0011137A2B|nr:hypothetical protein [Planctomicrobium piriforme]
MEARVLLAGGNHAPKLATIGGQAAIYTENQPPVLLAKGGTVTDVDSANFDGGMLVVKLSGARTGDLLSIQNQGTADGQIGLSGPNVTYGGTAIGTWSGGVYTGADTMSLTVTFNANSNTTSAQALIRTIGFSNPSDSPPETIRSLSFQISDGDGGTSAALGKSLEIRPINDPPVLANFGGAVAFTGQTPVILDGDATITDVDMTDLNGALLTVKIGTNAQASDILSIRNQGIAHGQVGIDGTNVTYGGSIIGAWSGGTNNVSLTIRFNVLAKVDASQAVLRNIQFSNDAVDRSSLPRTVRVVFDDGDGGVSSALTKTIRIENAPPQVGVFAGTVNYSAATGQPILVDYDATVSDSDSPNFAGGKLTIAISANAQSTDVLSIRNLGIGAGKIGVQGTNVTYGGVVIGTFTGGTNKVGLNVTFNSNATPQAVQTLLRNITFKSTLTAPVTAARTIRAILTDGEGGTSAAVTKTIRIV